MRNKNDDIQPTFRKTEMKKPMLWTMLILFISIFLALSSFSIQAAHINPTVIATIPVGIAPIAVGVNSTTSRIYVSNSWLSGPPRDDTISVIDSTNNTVITTISLGPLCNNHGTGNCLPADIGINSVTNRIYLPNFLDDTFSVIDGTPGSPTENSVIAAVIPVGDEPCRVAVNSTTNRVYITNLTPDRVTIIDGTPGSPTENSVIGTIPVGNGPCGIGVNPITNRIYVANFLNNTVSVIDGNNDTIIATIPVGVNPANVAVNPVTNHIYVPNQSSNSLSVIDGVSNSVLATIPMSNKPFGVDVNTTTNHIYVSIGFAAGSPNDSVAVIDGNSNSIITSVPVGDDPVDLAVDANIDHVYVANHLSNSVSVIADGLIPVDIDIKPGDDGNFLLCDRPNRNIRVAILTTDGFDALTVDHTTVTFAGASEAINPRTGEPGRHEKDADRDGDLDLVFHFRLGDTTLTCSSTEGTLAGETFAGMAVEGTDSILMWNRR